MIDVNVFLGEYPWRPLPGTGAEEILATMDRLGVSEAWLSHLPSLFWKDPAPGNALLYATVDRHQRFRPVPVIHPGLPRWEEELSEAADRGAVAVRADPGQMGLAPAGGELLALLRACGRLGLPFLAAVRLEDVRGRHPLDNAPELSSWMVRNWLRADPSVKLVLTHAERSFIEEVHFGSTPDEAARCYWDCSWVWGPPEDHLAHLLAVIGVDRFLFGSGQPLRLAETPVARLDLLDLSPADRAAILTDNAQRLAPPRRPSA